MGTHDKVSLTAAMMELQKAHDRISNISYASRNGSEYITVIRDLNETMRDLSALIGKANEATE